MFGDDDEDGKDGGKEDDVKVKDGQNGQQPANGKSKGTETGGGSAEGKKVDVEMGDELGGEVAGNDGSKKSSLGSEYEYDADSG